MAKHPWDEKEDLNFHLFLFEPAGSSF